MVRLEPCDLSWQCLQAAVAVWAAAAAATVEWGRFPNTQATPDFAETPLSVDRKSIKGTEQLPGIAFWFSFEV